jgi:hypothetical protein
MAKIHNSALDVEPADHEPVRLTAAERSRQLLEQYEREREAQQLQRRAERPQGRLSQGLKEKLSSCNIAQLKTVKVFCKHLIDRQSKPPRSIDCPSQFAVKVIASCNYQNKLYRAELKRTTQRADKVYVNGPYVYAYCWDGAYVRPIYFGAKGLSKKLPRRVWNALKDQISGHEVEKLKTELGLEWSRAASDAAVSDRE